MMILVYGLMEMAVMCTTMITIIIITIVCIILISRCVWLRCCELIIILYFIIVIIVLRRHRQQTTLPAPARRQLAVATEPSARGGSASVTGRSWTGATNSWSSTSAIPRPGACGISQ